MLHLAMLLVKVLMMIHIPIRASWIVLNLKHTNKKNQQKHKSISSRGGQHNKSQDIILSQLWDRKKHLL